MNLNKRFNNAEDKLIVSYNSEIGNLVGIGGKVESLRWNLVQLN